MTADFHHGSAMRRGYWRVPRGPRHRHGNGDRPFAIMLSRVARVEVPRFASAEHESNASRRTVRERQHVGAGAKQLPEAENR